VGPARRVPWHRTAGSAHALDPFAWLHAHP
jgi:hypothetical protein